VLLNKEADRTLSHSPLDMLSNVLAFYHTM